MKELIKINGIRFEAYFYDSMFEYLKGADFSYRNIKTEFGNWHEVPFIDKVFAKDEPEFTVDMEDSIELHGQKYVRVSFNDAVEEPIYLAEEALYEPIFLIYDEINGNNEYTNESEVYEIYDDAVDYIEFDCSNLGNEEFEEIMMELIGKESIQNLLGIDGVFILVSEHFNNEILEICGDWDNDDDFYDATVEFLEVEGASTILDAEGVRELLIEYFNNAVIEKWEEKQWQRIYDEEPKD